MREESREVLYNCLAIIEGAASSAEQPLADELWQVARNICYVIDSERGEKK